MSPSLPRVPEVWIASAAAAASLGALIVAVLIAPPDAIQGQAQRLMYVHVPAAWLAYACFAIVLVSSVAYLLRRDLKWDRRAQAAGELGVGMTALAIILGSLWGRPVWGTWWVWDPRLVTTVVLLLVYAGYLSIRGLGDDRDSGARRAAAVGILGFVNVPIVHFSVVWWRTLHQPATVLSPERAPLDGRMAAALLLAVVAFTLAGWLVLRRRVRMLLAADQQAQADPGCVVGSEPVIVRAAAGR